MIENAHYPNRCIAPQVMDIDQVIVRIVDYAEKKKVKS